LISFDQFILDGLKACCVQNVCFQMFSRLEDSTVNNLTLNEINAIWNFAKLNNRYEIPYKVSTGLSEQ